MMFSLKKTTLIFLSALVVLTHTAHAEQKYGFATKCKKTDALFPISFIIDDELDNFAGMAYNVIYIPEDQAGRADIAKLYKNSDGYDYTTQKQEVGRVAGTDLYGLFHDNDSAGAMTSYISQPVCTAKNPCQNAPSGWKPTVNHGMSAYDDIREQFPNDNVIVHSGMFPSLSNVDLRTTLFLPTRNFKLLRVEIMPVTNGYSPHDSIDWMQNIGSQPIVMQYTIPLNSNDRTQYYLDAFSRISRPRADSAMTEFPARLDRASIQSMDFHVTFSKGYLGETYSGVKFYYFNDEQKAILNKCGS
ncbi:hypothetical protein [Huaxiibacter chinensis]|uniref:hypothetical protein n=1 Tax=Huaxiibacter chinensis TaxID=2899785 RepID=UPI003D3207FF